MLKESHFTWSHVFAFWHVNTRNGFMVFLWLLVVYSQIDSSLINIYRYVRCVGFSCKATLLYSHSVCTRALILWLQVQTGDSDRKGLLVTDTDSLYGIHCTFITPINVWRSVQTLISLFFWASLFFHLPPLALHVLFELSSIAGTSRKIYHINIGSECLYWCPTWLNHSSKTPFSTVLLLHQHLLFLLVLIAFADILFSLCVADSAIYDGWSFWLWQLQRIPVWTQVYPVRWESLLHPLLRQPVL